MMKTKLGFRLPAIQRAETLNQSPPELNLSLIVLVKVYIHTYIYIYIYYLLCLIYDIPYLSLNPKTNIRLSLLSLSSPRPQVG